MNAEGWRLARFLARSGVASRRGAEELIRAGRVSVNGEVATDLGRRVRPGQDRVTVDGVDVEPAAGEVTLIHHKPRGVLVSRSDPHHTGQTVYDLLPEDLAPLAPRLAYAGRLDRDSEGLLVLSTDGDLVNALVHPRHDVEKEYEVTLDGELSAADADRLARGVQLEDGPTRPCVVERLGGRRVRVVLREGRKRQIRRMLALVGRRVVRLVRCRMGDVALGRLKPGEFRLATAGEVASFRADAAGRGPQGPDVH